MCSSDLTLVPTAINGGHHDQRRRKQHNPHVAGRAKLLHETAIHHGAFEAVAPPHDWWDWYAAYMDARQSGSTPDEASVAAGRYMAEVKDVVVPPG